MALSRIVPNSFLTLVAATVGTVTQAPRLFLNPSDDMPILHIDHISYNSYYGQLASGIIGKRANLRECAFQCWFLSLSQSFAAAQKRLDEGWFSTGPS
jgi:hypothetical protein